MGIWGSDAEMKKRATGQVSLSVVEVGAAESLDPPLGYTALETRSYGAAKVVFLILRD